MFREEVITALKDKGEKVLVGTFRPENLVWIQQRKLYNLPLPKCGQFSFHTRVSRIVLVAPETPLMAYSATFKSVVDSNWLKAEGYSIAQKGKGHGESYALYELREKLTPRAVLSDSDASVFVASSRCPNVRIDAAFYSRPYPKTGGTSMPYVFDQLRPYALKWRVGVAFNPKQMDFLESFHEKSVAVPCPPPEKGKFTFIDLFAGVGGFRLAMQSFGGKCVFSSEWDAAAQATYQRNYGVEPYGDITKPETKAAIPEKFDVLCGGFPCQPFSLAGVSARTSLNKKHGFQDKTQGTLFFDIMQIVRRHRPKVLFLENVKNLVSHDHGRTFRIIKDSIEAEGYSFNYRVIDASPLVPQKRLRCYMVCVRDGEPFDFPEISGPERKLSEILEKQVPAAFTISDGLWAGHQRRTRTNLARGTGFTAFMADVNKPAHTLVARYYKDGKECLIPQKGKNPRMLTPRECARLQGFPEWFVLPTAKSKAYKQMGNSVAVPVLKRIAKNICSQVLKIK